MDEARLQQLEQQLRHTQQQVQFLYAVVASTALGAIVLLLGSPGFSVPRKPAVQRVTAPFEVMGVSGKSLLRVEEDPASGTTCRLYNAEGKLALRLQADRAGGTVEVRSEQGRPVAQLDGGTGRLTFSEPRNQSVASIGLDPGGGCGVHLSSADLKQYAFLSTSDGGSSVELGEMVRGDGAQHISYRTASRMASHRGRGGLVLNDKDEKPLFTAP